MAALGRGRPNELKRSLPLPFPGVPRVPWLRNYLYGRVKWNVASRNSYDLTRYRSLVDSGVDVTSKAFTSATQLSKKRHTLQNDGGSNVQ